MRTFGNAASVLRLFVMLLFAVLALSACDSTSPAGTVSAGQTTRQVTVIGHGTVEGVPDTLTVDGAITFAAPDVTSAMNQVSQRQQAVIDALANAGVDRTDIATTNVSLQSQFGADGTTIVGYQASNSIQVKIRDLGSASQKLALIVSTGGDATRISSVNFAINDDSQLVKDARSRAFDDARDRAQQYADLSGLKLGKVISISEAPGAVPPPVPVPMPRGSMVAAAPVPLEPGQQTVSFDVTVIWELG